MTKKYVQPGNSMDVVLGGTVASGDIYNVGGAFGVHANGGSNGDTDVVHLVGVFDLAKDTSTAFAQGDRVYWDAANSKLVDDANFPLVGVAFAAAGSSDETVPAFIHPALKAASLVALTSSAGAGGAATEALTVTGLKSTDAIVAVSQKTDGSNSLPLLGWTTVADNALTCVWSADPGAGAVVVVLALR